MKSTNEQTKRTYEFGPFRLDAAERVLVRDGEAVSLKPKVFDTFLVLVPILIEARSENEKLKRESQ